MRLLLYKQDAISQLEDELNRIDKEEKAELFLGNARRDQNEQRKEVLQRLDEALTDYGASVHLTTPVLHGTISLMKQRQIHKTIAVLPQPATTSHPRFALPKTVVEIYGFDRQDRDSISLAL